MNQPESKPQDKPFLYQGGSEMEVNAPAKPEETSEIKPTTNSKQNILKVALIAGASLIAIGVIIGIVIFSTSSGKKNEPQEKPEIEEENLRIPKIKGSKLTAEEQRNGEENLRNPHPLDRIKNITFMNKFQEPETKPVTEPVTKPKKNPNTIVKPTKPNSSITKPKTEPETKPEPEKKPVTKPKIKPHLPYIPKTPRTSRVKRGDQKQAIADPIEGPVLIPEPEPIEGPELIPEPEKLPETRDEIVDWILKDMPKREEMPYSLFLVNLYYYANIQFSLDDESKAWYAFKWISQNIKYNTSAPKDPEGVYNAGSTVCHGYSRLLIKMMVAMGFKEENTKRIMGAVRLEDNCIPPNIGTVHEWTGLKINGKWELFDARRGTGTGKNNNFVFNFNPYYFNVPPYGLIRTHYPDEDNEEFQLLDHIVSEKEFCEMAAANTKYFSFGFTKIEPDLYNIYTTKPTGTLKYYFDPTKDVSFGSYLAFKGMRINVKVERKTDYYEVTYNLTEPGTYTVYFNGRDAANTNSLTLMGNQYIIYTKE